MEVGGGVGWGGNWRVTVSFRLDAVTPESTRRVQSLLLPSSVTTMIFHSAECLFGIYDHRGLHPRVYDTSLSAHLLLHVPCQALSPTTLMFAIRSQQREVYGVRHKALVALRNQMPLLVKLVLEREIRYGQRQAIVGI